ncbi:MAG TPA: 3-hydroxyacyl-CoA dehydrogenase NAD-binding domain-containing protein [Methylomirabilota bacterium]|nr:3-hydroxyacyl-CoA dehydrogenase NAD-binding domain-containing protein [Methylomirabilota bacterium]
MRASDQTIAVLGAGRIGRQIALAFALGGCRVRLIDMKEERSVADAERTLADARREMIRDAGLMVEEQVVDATAAEATLARIEERVGLGSLEDCGFVQEALPESVPLKRATLERLSPVVAEDAIVASGSSTISPSHLAEAIARPERFLVAHWLNPAHIIPLVDVVPSPLTSAATTERTLALLQAVGKVPVKCNDSPGFIGPRLQVLLMNEAVRLVEEGVATPEDVDRAFRSGMGFRYASIGIFEFIDWGGVDILYRAGRYMTEATGDPRFKPPKLVEQKMAWNELGPKTGRGFFDYSGDKRDIFETEKVRALLRRLRLERSA